MHHFNNFKKKKIAWFLGILLLIPLSYTAAKGLRFEFQLWQERFHYNCFTVDTNAMRACMNKYYHDRTQEIGATKIVEEVREHYDTYPMLRHECHPITHVIGRATAEHEKSIAKLFAQGDPFCWSGYYHGVVEGALRGVRDTDITKTFVNDFCASIPKTEANFFHYFNCIHGAGHAFMYVSHNELPLALDRCGLLTDDDDKQNCAAGAFMENIVASEDEHNTDYIHPNDPYFPCTMESMDPLFKNICYSTQAAYIWKNSPSPRDAFHTCNALKTKNERAACIEGLGREIAATNGNTVAGTIATCKHAGETESENICIIGAMKNFIAYYHDDILARELCNETTDPVKQACNIERTAYIKLFASSTSNVK